MDRRVRVLVGIVGVALAGSAIAATTKQRDPQGDVKVSCTTAPRCPPFEDVSERDVDIVEATAGRSSQDVLVHTLKVAGEVHPDNPASGTTPRANLFISTDSDRDAEYVTYYDVSDGKFGVYKNTKNGQRRTGKAVVVVRNGKAVFQFRARSIGRPDAYGWAFGTSDFEFPDPDTTDTVSAEDRIPSGKGYLKHRLD